MKKATRQTRQLVLSHLERVSSKIFSDYPNRLTEIVAGKHGVYALYKKNRTYYVGLATNLKKRIKQHLKDKHAGKWDNFSLYLVRNAEHIKEIESLILRIADPKGNSVKGRLSRSNNLRLELRRVIQLAHKQKEEDLFGKSPDKKIAPHGKLVKKKVTQPKQRGRQIEAIEVPADEKPINDVIYRVITENHIKKLTHQQSTDSVAKICPKQTVKMVCNYYGKKLTGRDALNIVLRRTRSNIAAKLRREGESKTEVRKLTIVFPPKSKK